jgi:sulfate adenylyltransferase (ADP) / ATP adenylyltransferase
VYVQRGVSCFDASLIRIVVKPFTLDLPYAHHVYRLPSRLTNPTTTPSEIADELGCAYITVLDLAFETLRHQSNPDSLTGVGLPPSYNVLLTLQHLHLIPRVKENHTLTHTQEVMSVNALGFAGYLLVKSDKEMKAVKEEGVRNILRGVAMEKVDSAGDQVWLVEPDDLADGMEE